MTEAAGTPSPLSRRALFVGLLLALLVAMAGPYFTLMVQGSNAGGAFYTSPMSHFLLFAIVGFVNVAVGALRRTWSLGKGELVTAYVLMTLGNQALAICFYLVPALCGPYYYASAENNWPNLLHPYLPGWIAPNEIREFLEGAYDRHAPVNWQVWVRPLLSWLPLLAAVHVGTLCMMVVVRRQWSERERIGYPLTQIAANMVQDDERRSLIKPFFRDPVMWLGFSIPFLIGLMDGLHAYFPYIPELVLRTSIPLPGGVSMNIVLSFIAVGFFFLINLEVAFSLWMFVLLNLVQKGIYNTLGIAAEAEPALHSAYDLPSLVHQSMGAMIVLVLSGLFVARGHLWNVLRKGLFNSADVGDQDEVISYRGAILGLALSAAVIVFWLVRSGIPLAAVLVFLFFVFVVYMAVTRVVVEGGVAMLYTPLVPPDAALSALGSSMFGAHGIVGLTFARIWGNDVFNFAMPHCANGLKLSEQVSGTRRPLFSAMLAAMMLGLAGSVGTTLYLGYTYGAINMSNRHFVWLAQFWYDFAAVRIAVPIDPSWAGWLHTIVGALVMGLLMVAQRVWLWWPLHPIGYPISSVFGWMAFNAFLAWLFKGTVLKYGGPRLFRRVRPFFLGLIMGQFAAYGVFWIVDPLTGMVGNSLMN